MILTGDSSRLVHILQNLFFIALSFASIPLDTALLIASYVLNRFLIHSREPYQRHVVRSNPDFKRRTVLVTGIGMTKGLALARLFYAAGHDVIGADFEPGGALVCGRVSVAIKRFYRLNPPSTSGGSEPYLRSLLEVVRKEHVDLWVSCSGVASAVEDGLAMQVVQTQTSCKAVQFDAPTTRLLHEKGSFIDRVQELGLPTPHTVEVTSREEVERVLASAPNDRKYILKPVGMDDSARGDMTLLPLPSMKQTNAHLARLKINPASPWIVQQFIGGLEFCTHALVIRGEVRAFVASPSAELLMHYSALSAASPLSMAMLEFTKTFAEKSGDNFTGHLSFDFLVEYADLNRVKAEDITLYPIECNPRAHTAVALFNDTPELADAYMSVLDKETKLTYADVVDPSPARRVITPTNPSRYYWSGHDLTTLLILPVIDLVLFRISLGEFIQNLDVLVDHLLTWRDGTFLMWDPLPWWWLYHVYWPLRFWHMLVQGRKWSRVNVSTGKMFEC